MIISQIDKHDALPRICSGPMSHDFLRQFHLIMLITDEIASTSVAFCPMTSSDNICGRLQVVTAGGPIQLDELTRGFQWTMFTTRANRRQIRQIR